MGYTIRQNIFSRPQAGEEFGASKLLALVLLNDQNHRRFVDESQTPNGSAQARLVSWGAAYGQTTQGGLSLAIAAHWHGDGGWNVAGEPSSVERSP